MSAQSKYYNTGGGELFFTPIVNGILGVETAFGQTENVDFSYEAETITHDSTENETTLEDMSILRKITGKLAIETVEISPEMLTKAFLGNDNSTIVAANAIATTASLGFVTATALDTAYEIGVKHLDEATIIVKDDADLITYVLGDDYSLLTKNNVTTITFLTGGSGVITAGDIIHITADNVSYNDISIEAFIESKLEGQLRFISAPANGVSYVYTFHKVSLLASGDYMLKSTTEFAKLSFEGSLLASELITAQGISKLFKIEGSEVI